MSEKEKELEKPDNTSYHDKALPNKGAFWYNKPIMLPNEYRLKRMKDFEILFKEGWFVAGNLLTAKVWRINVEKYQKRDYKESDLKIGFVVGLKVSKKAVDRNHLKRQMREVVRLLLKDNRIKSGYMIAFVAKPEMLGAKYETVEKEVLNIFKKGNLFK